MLPDYLSFAKPPTDPSMFSGRLYLLVNLTPVLDLLIILASFPVGRYTCHQDEKKFKDTDSRNGVQLAGTQQRKQGANRQNNCRNKCTHHDRRRQHIYVSTRGF